MTIFFHSKTIPFRIRCIEIKKATRWIRNIFSRTASNFRWFVSSVWLCVERARAFRANLFIFCLVNSSAASFKVPNALNSNFSIQHTSLLPPSLYEFRSQVLVTGTAMIFCTFVENFMKIRWFVDFISNFDWNYINSAASTLIINLEAFYFEEQSNENWKKNIWSL